MVSVIKMILEIKNKIKKSKLNLEPFPHIIIKNFLPKKLYLGTTQAVETPNSVLNNPTPNIRSIVLEMYLGKTVENK